MVTIECEGIQVSIGMHQGKRIILGADHRGFSLKEALHIWLEDTGYIVENVGTYSAERCDYVPISDTIGGEISKAPATTVGIGICGSGQGILIPALKHPGVIGTRCLSVADAKSSRQHNNANMITLGADITSEQDAIKILQAWLSTSFYTSESDEPYLHRYVQTRKLELKKFLTTDS
jgi:RpiB/LacA/LacB family sugar-phosphate isomerase